MLLGSSSISSSSSCCSSSGRPSAATKAPAAGGRVRQPVRQRALLPRRSAAGLHQQQQQLLLQRQRCHGGGVRCRAGGPDGAAGGSGDDEEARIEALEQSTRKARGKAAVARPIPIRNVTPRAADSAPAPGRAAWREGQLLPDGWDEMDWPTRVTELYIGQRGMLFWSVKVAYGAAWVVGGAWVLFRVAGALGVLKLANDLPSPPVF